jgi:hypothetical protein
MFGVILFVAAWVLAGLEAGMWVAASLGLADIVFRVVGVKP